MKNKTTSWPGVAGLIITLGCLNPAAAASHVDEASLGVTIGTPGWGFKKRAQYAFRRGFFTNQRTQPHFLPELRVDAYGRPVGLDHVPFSACRKYKEAKHCSAEIGIQGRTHHFSLDQGNWATEQIQGRARFVELVGNTLPFTLTYRDDKLRRVNLGFPGGVIVQCDGRGFHDCESKAATLCPTGYTVDHKFERRSYFSPVHTVRDIVAICNGAAVTSRK